MPTQESKKDSNPYFINVCSQLIFIMPFWNRCTDFGFSGWNEKI